MNKILAIAGISGSGKTTLEAGLTELADVFHKWYQFSTRPKRNPKEDIYIFVESETYEKFDHLLTAQNHYGTSKYGSIPDFKDGTISTVIVNYIGLNNLKADIKSGKIDAELFVLGLDVLNEDIPKEAKREGRDESFLEKEREVLQYADHIFTIKNGKYLQPAEVIDILKTYKFI